MRSVVVLKNSMHLWPYLLKMGSSGGSTIGKHGSPFESWLNNGPLSLQHSGSAKVMKNK